MPLPYYVQTFVVGLAITLILYFHAGRRGPYASAAQNVFRLLILSNMALLLLEMLLILFTGVDTAFARITLPIAVLLFYLINPVPEALWVFLLDAVTHGERRPTKRQLWITLLPAAFNAALCIASLFTGWLYTISPQNVYGRGPYFFLMPFSCYAYLAYYIVFALLKRHLVLKREYATLLCAALPPILAGILQSLFFGLSVVWISLSFSLLIYHMNLQSSQVYTDHLTGLSNRRKFDELLLKLPEKRKLMGGMMIDVDGFKQINDVHGHLMGDQVLETVGTLLRRSLRRSDFVARIGGDEFAVLADVENQTQLAGAVERIEK
ncbi:MAG TPA: GGDEF domain-containing protein, partial [Clostridia bacterium]|nr:GGDEF domain-containing protein [Clostridia bacterium]